MIKLGPKLKNSCELSIIFHTIKLSLKLENSQMKNKGQGLQLFKQEHHKQCFNTLKILTHFSICCNWDSSSVLRYMEDSRSLPHSSQFSLVRWNLLLYVSIRREVTGTLYFTNLSWAEKKAKTSNISTKKWNPLLVDQIFTHLGLSSFCYSFTIKRLELDLFIFPVFFLLHFLKTCIYTWI